MGSEGSVEGGEVGGDGGADVVPGEFREVRGLGLSNHGEDWGRG